MSEENFTNADIQKIGAMSVEEAKEFGHKLIDLAGASKHPIKPEKVAYLHNSVNKCIKTIDVVSLFYNMLLAGEGLASINSKYGKKFA